MYFGDIGKGKRFSYLVLLSADLLLQTRKS